MKFNAMFSPVSIGPMTVPNRFVVPPMGNNFANTDGTLSSRSLAYYEARAKGGFGLITIEATVVDPNAKAGPRKPCLFSDHVVESFPAGSGGLPCSWRKAIGSASACWARREFCRSRCAAAGSFGHSSRLWPRDSKAFVHRGSVSAH